MKKLCDLTPGRSATVCAIEATGVMKRRIMDMGLVTGTMVTLVSVAPMGDPLEIRLRGYHLSLRMADAGCIYLADDETSLGGF